MSEARTKPRTFFNFLMDGQATRDGMDDFIDAWHDSGDEDQRSLTEFLGMTNDEYDLWTMDARTLPELALARRPGAPSLTTLMADRVRRLRVENDPANGTALFSPPTG